MIGKYLSARISEREIRKMGQIRGNFFRFESVHTKIIWTMRGCIIQMMVLESRFPACRFHPVKTISLFRKIILQTARPKYPNKTSNITLCFAPV